MSDNQFLGNIPSPYGVPIAVYKHPDTDEDFLHDTEGSMTLAGIYHPQDRVRCKAALAQAMGGNVRFQIFMDHGGHTIPKEKLERPDAPVYPTLPKTHGMSEPIENWVTLFMDLPAWDMRAARVLDIIGGNFGAAQAWRLGPDLTPMAVSLGLAHLLTAALEHTNESEIDCLEAAAFYALTLHPQWRRAGTRWLFPFRKTWLKDWLKSRPVYRKFARGLSKIESDIPSWIGGAA